MAPQTLPHFKEIETYRPRGYRPFPDDRAVPWWTDSYSIFKPWTSPVEGDAAPLFLFPGQQKARSFLSLQKSCYK